VRACGRDANGDPDAPSLCFLCRQEAARGRQWHRAQRRYLRPADLDDADPPRAPSSDPAPTCADPVVMAVAGE
jgi:hypothetical protein